MDKKMSNNGLLIRAQALVLVGLMIVAGSIAMTPAIFASEGGNNEIKVVTEFVGPNPIQVDVTQSTSVNCYPGSKISVLQIDITNLGGAPDTFNTLMIQYTGTNPADIQILNSAELWFDMDANGIYNPAIDMPIAPTNIGGGMFFWGGLGLPVFPAPAPTRTYWVLVQVDNAATVGNIVDALIVPGGIGFLSGFSNIAPMDPNDAPDFCTIQTNLAVPQPIYGYVTAADLTTPIPGIGVTVTEAATGETIGAITDANGRYDIDINDLLLGYTDGDLIEASTIAPNQAYNNAILVVAGPPALWNISLIVDATVPTSSVSIVPAANNTGTWNVDFAYDDALVNGYASGVYSVDIYVETPLTPGVYNFWIGQIDGAFTGTEVYTPIDGEGIYNFYSIATDYAGNVEAVPGVLPDDGIIYDITAPIVNVDGPATSDVQAFTVTYAMNDPVPASGVANASLWWTFDGGASWTEYGDDAATGSFNVDVGTLSGDGTYGWYTAAWDIAGNNEAYPPTVAGDIEFETLVDTSAPVIGITSVDKLYINNHGTFTGTPPPVLVTTTVTDTNLAAASWGIRNDLQIGNSTIYFGCDITNEGMPATYGWDGSWYFVDGVLVTASISPANVGTDLVVMGEVNGASNAGDVIGSVMPSHYATFDQFGAYQSIYDTQGTFDFSDDGLPITENIGDTFRAYRYDEGAGYIATVSVSTKAIAVDWVTLTIAPILDGRYAVCVSAIDEAGNTAWTNETTGNPVVTVDNYPAYANATGPATSDVFAFDVTYDFVTDPLPSSGFVDVNLWYDKDAAGWLFYGNELALDGAFAVDVSGFGDGVYEWYMTAFDNTDNRAPITMITEATTLVDTAAPNIGATTVDKLYINNQGTFGGIAPPVLVTTTVTDTNLAAASWGIRNDLQIGNSTIYFGCDITNEGMPATYGWDGSWYFVDGVLVTASISPANVGTDLVVMGEVNGASNAGDVIGSVMPSHYATFDQFGAYQSIYDTQGTFDFSDDGLPITENIGDTFRAYRYDEGAGYIATVSVSTKAIAVDWVTLTIAPILDGRYAVCVSAIDEAGNTAWTNETTGNPVITVDNYAPDADATGPATSILAAFDVTYAFTDVVAPNGATPSGIVNVSLWYSHDGGAWTKYAVDDPTPGDGLFPIDTATMAGDGSYDWFIISYDLADNNESHVFAIEATTLVDSTNPVVTTTTPLDGAVDIILAAGTYVIEFSEPMDTLAGVVTSDLPGVVWAWDGTGMWLNGTYNALTESTTYNIDLNGGGFQDVLGNPLVIGVYGWTFSFSSIGVNPVIVTTTLLDGAVDVSMAAGTYVIEFNEPMDTLAGVVTSDLPGVAWAWDGTGMWLNGTYNALTESTIYNVDLSTGGFQDTSANALIVGGYGWTFTFTSIGVNPVIVTTTPIDGAVGVLLNADIVITFSEEIDTVTFTYTIAPNPGGWVVSWNGPTNDQVTLSHTDFSEFMAYTFTVTVADDIYGNSLVAGAVPNPWTFETIGTFNLNYIAGWNLISIPVLNPTVGGVPLVSADDLANLGALMVSSWNGAGYVNYIPGFHNVADPQNFALVPDEAYWIWMPGPGAIAINGDLPHQRNVNVVVGWNMIGYMDPSTVGDVDTDWALQVSCGAYDDIAYYDGVTFQHYIFSGTVMTLSPGRGYFVWSDGAATITYGS